jgi:hypothetical protein
MTVDQKTKDELGVIDLAMVERKIYLRKIYHADVSLDTWIFFYWPMVTLTWKGRVKHVT